MTRIIELLKWICFGAMIVLLAHMLVRGTPSRASFETVQSAVVSAADMTNMSEGDNQMVRRLYGIDPEEFAGTALYYPASNMAAEELLLVKLSDASQEEALLEAVRQRLDSQKENFDGYGTEQTELLSHSVIAAKGNYVLFAVAENPSEIKTAFLNVL